MYFPFNFCMCVVFMCVHSCVLAAAREGHWMSWSVTPHLTLLRKSHLELDKWWASPRDPPSWPLLPPVALRLQVCTKPCSAILYRFWSFEPRPSYLHNKHFYLLNHLPSPFFLPLNLNVVNHLMESLQNSISVTLPSSLRALDVQNTDR